MTLHFPMVAATPPERRLRHRLCLHNVDSIFPDRGMPNIPYTVEDHIQLRRVSSIAASPDGTWLAVAGQRLDREGT